MFRSSRRTEKKKLEKGIKKKKKSTELWLSRYHICSNFPNWTIKVNQCCFWLEFIKNIAIKKRALDGSLERILEKVTRVKLSLDQNLLDTLKVTTQFKQYFFDKDGSNLRKRTIWVKLYCPVIKIYKKHFKEKEKKAFHGNLLRILEITRWFKWYCILVWVYWIFCQILSVIDICQWYFKVEIKCF